MEYFKAIVFILSCLYGFISLAYIGAALDGDDMIGNYTDVGNTAHSGGSVPPLSVSVTSFIICALLAIIIAFVGFSI